jgi:hypothetical protein
MDTFTTLLSEEVQDPLRKSSTIERNVRVLADRLCPMDSLKTENEKFKSRATRSRSW